MGQFTQTIYKIYYKNKDNFWVEHERGYFLKDIKKSALAAHHFCDCDVKIVKASYTTKITTIKEYKQKEVK